MSGRRDGEREAQEELSRVGEALCYRVEEDDGKGHGGKQEADPVDEDSSDDEEGGAGRTGGNRRAAAKEPVASLGTGVALVDLPVSNAVKGHRRRPGKDHAEQDQAEDPPTREAIGRHEHRPKGEGERENRV
jgi:hypothetical protein